MGQNWHMYIATGIYIYIYVEASMHTVREATKIAWNLKRGEKFKLIEDKQI